jgi:hypothetical protein
MTRRIALRGGALAAAGAMVSPQLVAVLQTPPQTQDREGFEAFVERAQRQVATLYNDASATGQDRYVQTLAAELSGMQERPAIALGEKSFRDLDPAVLLGTRMNTRPFFVVLWELAPNAVLPAHCHPRTSVCTLCLGGRARLRHFQVAKNAPAYNSNDKASFNLQQTRDMELTPGIISTLTETRDNVHLFQAGSEGAFGLDVTTDYGGDGSFSFLGFLRRLDAPLGIPRYEAQWLGSKVSFADGYELPDS